jgi:hypothetical protein
MLRHITGMAHPIRPPTEVLSACRITGLGQRFLVRGKEPLTFTLGQHAKYQLRV